ncbi:MAG: SusC/RagA family TonB-linked outer membrane protein, partial [Tannerellaceae bacterium]|nr:SusC/RagA family TonB-linked outer membrane protein [Tannerellaceae bacterium]
MRNLLCYKRLHPVFNALAILLLFTCSLAVKAATAEPQQSRTVSGTVVDEAGDALIGVNIQIRGTATGSITDIDGKFSFQAPSGNLTIQVSYVGYITQTIAVTGNQALRIVLKEDSQNLDEVVVVGYGTQAKKDITGAVAVVSAEALAETPVSTFAEALMGKAAGVYVSSSGAPGASTTIRIRGVGSVNGSDPLVIVDGVQGVNTESVNPNDIESFQILKDASATAIYGAQGANGVIIVTTKKGSKDRVRISYNGYGGASTMANSGYNLLNAWESMEFVAQGMVNLRDVRGFAAGDIPAHAQFGSLDANDQLRMPYAVKPSGMSESEIVSQFGSIAAWEASYKPDGSNSWARSAYAQMKLEGYSEEEARAGTDWYNLVTQTGMVQDHQISAMGGNDKGQYSISLGMNSREGTIKSSYFDRYSMRINTSFTPSKWMTIGANVNLAAVEIGGERGNQGDGDVFGKVYTTASWLPVYNIGGDFAGSQAPEGGRNTSAYNAVINQQNDWTRNFRGEASVFAEVTPISGLILRTQYSPRLTGTWIRTFSEVTIAADKEGSANNNLYEEARYSFDWQWTNTATYSRTFNRIHQATVVVGSEALNNGLGRRISARRINYTFPNDPNSWNIDNGSTSNLSNSGYMDDHTAMFGLFGRGDYVYNDKYLATVSFRYDGSSKFGANNRFGFFPSLSAGWRMT